MPQEHLQVVEDLVEAAEQRLLVEVVAVVVEERPELHQEVVVVRVVEAEVAELPL